MHLQQNKFRRQQSVYDRRNKSLTSAGLPSGQHADFMRQLRRPTTSSSPVYGTSNSSLYQVRMECKSAEAFVFDSPVSSRAQYSYTYQPRTCTPPSPINVVSDSAESTTTPARRRSSIKRAKDQIQGLFDKLKVTRS